VSVGRRLGHPVRRQPLRVKLVATVLAMLTIALALIGVASTTFMREGMMRDLDEQLAKSAEFVRKNPSVLGTSALPSFSARDSALITWDQTRARWNITVPRYAITDMQVPPLPANLDEARKNLGEPYTVRSEDKTIRWRMLTMTAVDGQVFIAGVSQDDVDRAASRLVLINLVGGVGVLLLAASIGATLVQQTLRPLKAIEKTAGAIAAGDLTRRVPDPEPGAPEPRTEVGSLARSLNSMLAQIETAFTERAASEQAARVSEARARRSEEKMRRFVGDASHELRTPLTTIRGFAELFRQGAVTSPEDIASLVKRIEDEARRMGLLVEDLLMLARLDQERPLRPAPVELRELAVDAVQAARVVAPDRTIGLEIAPGAQDMLVVGDDARLRQVVNNLMSNALGHTPAGSPIEVRLRAEGGQGVMEIADSGPGLTGEQRERVFERFYRADAARTRRADGHVSTGLGLAIVAALVAAHEGTVEVDSEPGHGAVFRVRLPLVEIVDDDDDGDDGVVGDSGHSRDVPIGLTDHS
jgi:two-component system, OmpR family, sensor kinase